MLGLKNDADLRTLGLILAYYAAAAVAWRRIDALSLPAQAAAVAVVSFLAFLCACIIHNTMHCAVFRKRWMNKAFQLVLTLSFGHPVALYVPGHNLSHHKFTQLRKDIMRTSKLQHRWHLLNLLLFQPTVTLDVTRSDLRYLVVQKHLNPGYFEQTMREFVVLLLVTVALLARSPFRFFWVFYVPHLVAQWAIVSVNILQHDGCDVEPEGATELKSGERNVNAGRNFVGPVMNWLTCNNGFHQIHHMYPYRHWSEYPALHAREVAPRAHPALAQQHLSGYAWRTFVWPGRRETYDGRPVVFDADTDAGPAFPDQDWITYPDKLPKARLDAMTAADMVRIVAGGAALAVVKLVAPMYSPNMSVV